MDSEVLGMVQDQRLDAALSRALPWDNVTRIPVKGLADSTHGHKTRSKTVKAKTSRTSTSTQRKASITRMASRRKPDATPDELLAAEGIDLKSVMQELQQQSDVNASRVVKLHTRIEGGDYEIDSNVIAEKLLKLETSLDKP